MAVNSGTAALELILRSLNIKNKKVLISSNTFIATALAAKSAGAVPIPVDIDDDYFGICPTDLKKKINKDTGAVIIVHIGGLVTKNILKIKKICLQKKIPLIEDCAQAYASSYNKHRVGNFGIAGAFSFQTTKVIASGEGGIVTTNNKIFYKKLLSNRFYGVDFKDPLSFVSEGNNLKMTELIALSVICDLERSKKRILKRQQIAKRYQVNLKNTKWITLKPHENSETSYYKQIIISPIDRIELTKKMIKKNISLTGGVYFRPLHRQQIVGIKKDKYYPNASFFADNHFCPPCYPELTLNEIDYICNSLKEIA